MSSYASQATQAAGTSEWNRLEFAVRSIMGRMATATLVQVKSVGSGTVDVQPLVHQLDGARNAVPHGVIHGLPVWRLQGGIAAIVVDPAIGDIGLAVFAHSDISSAKANKGAANPSSLRKFDWADGIYLGGLLNADPTSFVRFGAGGAIDIQGSGTLTLTSTNGSIRLSADMASTTSAFAAGNGATGTFTSQDGKTVTVLNGIVTRIV